MHTLVLKLDSAQRCSEAFKQAAEVLRAGGLVAFPTETVYGLGANAQSAMAVQRLYEAKRRSPDDPCIVHIERLEDLARVAALATIPSGEAAQVQALATAFWPGPLSLILPRAPDVPAIVSAGRATVAVRIPDHPVALALIRAAGVPLAAPSANIFMHTSPTTARHVLDDLDGRIDLVLDCGPTTVGVESTVLDLSSGTPTILRPGGVSLEQLQTVLGTTGVVAARAGATETEAALAGTLDATPSWTLPHVGLAAPGLLAKHYAPRAEVVLFDGPRLPAIDALARKAATLLAGSRVTGALLCDEHAQAIEEQRPLPGLRIALLGPEEDLHAHAQRLFAGLRELEAQGVEVMLALLPRPAGLGQAIRDRLTRAAGGKVITVEN